MYAKAADNLQRMVKAGVLIRDATPFYYVYRLTWRDRVQTGLAAVASLADYETNRIRKHELTTPVKEDDRVRQIEAVNAQTGPVMVAYPAAPAIDAMLAQATLGGADVDVTADDGVRHQMWVVDDDATIGGAHARVRRAAGGLHRRRAPSLGRGRARRRARGGNTGHARAIFSPSLFPHHQMTILDYNRVVKRSERPHAQAAPLSALRENFTVKRPDRPVRPGGPESSAWSSTAAGTA